MKKTLIKPHITEKSISLTRENKYTFEISNNASKEDVKKAVEGIFNVTVLSINTCKNTPELKRNWKKGVKYEKGGIKKALVKLKKGQKIELFDLEEKK